MYKAASILRKNMLASSVVRAYRAIGDDESYLAELADFLRCELMSFMSLRAYCDESYAAQQAPDAPHPYADRPYVIAGYIGTARIWKKFERQWKHQLKLENLPYFHMADCQAGAGKVFGYLDLATDAGRAERDRLQRVFIGLINRFEIYGVAAGVPQDHFASLHEALARYRPPQPGQKQPMLTPYLFSLEVCFHAMFARLRGHEDEVLAFVFDENREFEGRAHAVRAQLRENELYSNRHRLGPLTYCKKVDAVALQAADILAYECMRKLRDPAVERWQMKLLNRSIAVSEEYMSPEILNEFLDRVHAELVPAVE